MKMKKLFLTGMFVIAVMPGMLIAQNLTITQIDSGRLLETSRIDCFLSLTDKEGIPLTTIDPGEVKIQHEKQGGMSPAEILSIVKNGASDTAMTFLLVIDNSGSMYDPVGHGEQGSRMEHALKALYAFLDEIKSSKTRVGAAVFNTRYTLLSKPVKDIMAVEEALKRITKPDKKESYTELYYAITRAADDLSRYRGRKAVILLSDGENYPYFKKSGKPNPETGTALYKPEDSLDRLIKDGITLYGINFSLKKDPSLSRISVESGGTVFDALTGTELSGVYQSIQNRIKEEYRVTIAAPLTFLGAPKVKVEYGTSHDTKTYYARSLAGKPADHPVTFALILLLLTIVIWILLVKIRFEKASEKPEISMIPLGAGKPLQRTIALDSPKTVIGAAQGADFTITGIPDLKESHATIVKNEKTGTFTVVSDFEIRVNNNLTKKRDLKPGDVINIEGATIIFDAPEE